MTKQAEVWSPYEGGNSKKFDNVHCEKNTPEAEHQKTVVLSKEHTSWIPPTALGISISEFQIYLVRCHSKQEKKNCQATEKVYLLAYKTRKNLHYELHLEKVI